MVTPERTVLLLGVPHTLSAMENKINWPVVYLQLGRPTALLYSIFPL